MVRIRRFGIVRTANVAAIAYLLLTLIIVLPFVLILAAAGPMEFTDSLGRTASVEMSPLWLLLLPLLYAVIGWLVTAMFCLVYNLAAAITGGAEMQLLTDRPAEVPPAG
jgi:L-cystine uptake protein TcyP (sodium:dicarboxylate symporter family)